MVHIIELHKEGLNRIMVRVKGLSQYTVNTKTMCRIRMSGEGA